MVAMKILVSSFDGNLFELTSQLSQRFFKGHAFEARCTDKSNDIGVLIDVSSILGRRDGATV
jgi:hypothetical protein